MLTIITLFQNKYQCARGTSFSLCYMKKILTTLLPIFVFLFYLQEQQLLPRKHLVLILPQSANMHAGLKWFKRATFVYASHYREHWDEPLFPCDQTTDEGKSAMQRMGLWPFHYQFCAGHHWLLYPANRFQPYFRKRDQLWRSGMRELLPVFGLQPVLVLHGIRANGRRMPDIFSPGAIEPAILLAGVGYEFETGKNPQKAAAENNNFKIAVFSSVVKTDINMGYIVFVFGHGWQLLQMLSLLNAFQCYSCLPYFQNWSCTSGWAFCFSYHFAVKNSIKDQPPEDAWDVSLIEHMHFITEYL